MGNAEHRRNGYPDDEETRDHQLTDMPEDWTAEYPEEDYVSVDVVFEN